MVTFRETELAIRAFTRDESAKFSLRVEAFGIHREDSSTQDSAPGLCSFNLPLPPLFSSIPTAGIRIRSIPLESRPRVCRTSGLSADRR